MGSPGREERSPGGIVRPSRGSWRVSAGAVAVVLAQGRCPGLSGVGTVGGHGVPAASLVEEVSLQRGRQRQRRDGAQALLPQGQAHGAPAEIHERQGLGIKSIQVAHADLTVAPDGTHYRIQFFCP